MITNNLIEDIEAWLIDIECEATEMNQLSDDNLASECCYEDFLMIDLNHGYKKRQANLKPITLANKTQ